MLTNKKLLILDAESQPVAKYIETDQAMSMEITRCYSEHGHGVVCTGITYEGDEISLLLFEGKEPKIIYVCVDGLEETVADLILEMDELYNRVSRKGECL